MDDMDRLEFEEKYIAHLNEGTGKDYEASDMVDLREGDSYGDRPYLNGAWFGWKAARVKTPVVAEKDNFGLSVDQVEKLLNAGLKSEEIGGTADVQHDRVVELMHWFARLADNNANPKWLRGHAFELAYYIASNGINQHLDMYAFKQASFLEGVNITPAERGMLTRIGVIKSESRDDQLGEGNPNEILSSSELKETVDIWLRDLRRAYVNLDEGKPFFSGKDCSELADLVEFLFSSRIQDEEGKLKPYAERCPENIVYSAYLLSSESGFTLKWSVRHVGIGEFNFSVDPLTQEVKIWNECMGSEFIKHVLNHLVDNAKLMEP